MEQLPSLERNVEHTLDAAEFTDGRARSYTLEQVFVWRSELACALRDACEELTEVAAQRA